MTATVKWRELGPALLVLAGSITFLFWARSYSGRSGAMPELVAWLTIALSLIDVIIQFDTAPSRALRRLVTAKRIVEWKMEGEEDASFSVILRSIAWVVGYVVLLYFVGFLIATPIYMFLYLLFHGGHNLRNSVLVTAGTTLLIWLTFEVAFKYPLYPGVLFGGY
jgi:Tripartite tricarboxylate transporter TctB family